jgi:hypothetical protein
MGNRVDLAEFHDMGTFSRTWPFPIMHGCAEFVLV